MMNTTAQAGRAGQTGHSHFKKWVRPEHAVPVADKRLRGLIAPIAYGKSFEDAPDLSAKSTQGSPGETGGRPTGPVQFVSKLMEAWRLDRQDTVRLLGFDPEDFEYVAAVLDGRRQFRGRDVRDRIAHLFCIRRTLWSLFRDPDTENCWLREPHSMLNGASPLSLMLEGSMEDLLLARDYVEAAAGVR